MPETATSLSISFVLPVHDDWERTFGCLMSLVQSSSGLRRETIVVDNGSTDATRAALPMLEGIHLIRNEQDEGFARACNQALRVAQGDVLLLLDASAQVTDGVIPHVLRDFEDPEVAAAAPAPEAGLGSMLAVRASEARLAGGWDESREDSTEALVKSFVTSGRRIALFHSPRMATPAGDRQEAPAPSTPAPIASPVVSPAPTAPCVASAPPIAPSVASAPPIAPPAASPAPIAPSVASPPTAARPPVTVVLPVHDAGPGLGWCLESIGRNLGAEDELVIADGGSQDDTLRSAYLYAAMHPRQVRVVTNPSLVGLPAAVRQGVDAASRQVMVVVHANLAAPDGFLDGLLQVLTQDPRTDAVGVEVPRTGVCLAGPSALVRRIGGAGPEALFQADGLALAEAMRRAGARLAFVPAAP